jgi:hypothetical protein
MWMKSLSIINCHPNRLEAIMANTLNPATITSALLAASALAAPYAVADVVTDWNDKAVAAGYSARISPDLHSRSMAIVHLAAFEALNSIDPRYMPYRARLPAEPGASPQAAVATAAHDALVGLFPEQAKDFDAALQDSLDKLPDGPGKSSGVRLGGQAAAAMLAEREKDGATTVIHYRPFTVAGKYVPTVIPASSSWSGVRPFALKTGDQFRPAPPYALTSTQWVKDFNEIKSVGAKTGSSRTAEQTDIARFWQVTGPATYNPVARQLATAKNLNLLDTARMFALSSMATADAAIAVFDAKYTYGFWRPVTAIRCADMDGNDATQMDAEWEPFTPTPMHPEYPCAHCIFQGSAAGVLRALYGDTVPRFTMTSSTAPGVSRSFDNLSDYVADVVNGRIYEGVHYRTSGEVGAAMGRQIGEYVVQNQLRPLR